MLRLTKLLARFTRSTPTIPSLDLLPIDSGNNFDLQVQNNFRQITAQCKITAPAFFDPFTPEIRLMGLCALLAHAAKPYGSGSGPNLSSMLAAPALDCSNYGLLGWHMAKTIMPDLDSAISLHFTGWQSKSIGNHQLLFVAASQTPEIQLLLDPTTGIIAKASFDHICSGRAVNAADIMQFPFQTTLNQARHDMIFALTSGKIRPSELLYFFSDADHLLKRYGSPQDWPTPGAIEWRRLYS